MKRRRQIRRGNLQQALLHHPPYQDVSLSCHRVLAATVMTWANCRNGRLQSKSRNPIGTSPPRPPAAPRDAQVARTPRCCKISCIYIEHRRLEICTTPTVTYEEEGPANRCTLSEAGDDVEQWSPLRGGCGA